MFQASQRWLNKGVGLFRPRTVEDRNVLYLCLEVIFGGILAAAGSFNSAYILRAGGSNSLVGLLSSLPSLVAVILFMPSARVLEGKRNYMPMVVGSLFWSRVGYLLILLLPFFFRQLIPEISVVALVAMSVPSVFFATGWSPMLADVIPADRRAGVLAWRSILSSATIASLTYFAGLWLDRAVFPGNYQWMYGVGLAGGLISVWLIGMIRLPEAGAAHVPAAQATKESWLETWRSAQSEHKGFVRITVNTFLFNLGAWMVGPLYIIFYVRNLGASDTWVGLHTTLAHVGVVVGYWVWRKIVKRIGVQPALLWCLPVLCAHGIMVAFLPDLNVLLFVGFLINAIAPGVNLSHSILFLELLPPGKKMGWTAFHSMIMNIGAFVCPLIGVALADKIGIVPTLVIGTVMRYLGALLFYIYPVKGDHLTFTWPQVRLPWRKRI